MSPSIKSASSNCVSATVVPLSALSTLIALNVTNANSPGFFRSLCLPDQAGCATGRTTGASTIGRLIRADSTPNSTESHQIGVYDPNFSNTTPPSSTPRKPPTWWLTKANPYSVANQRVPNIKATSADVGGTVESQVRPVEAPKMIAENVVIGNEMKATIDIARAIDHGQDVALWNFFLQPASTQRADDVEQADGGDHPAASLRGNTAIG